MPSKPSWSTSELFAPAVRPRHPTRPGVDALFTTLLSLRASRSFDALCPCQRHSRPQEHEKLSLEELRRVARLARIQLSPEDEPRMLAEMNEMLRFISVPPGGPRWPRHQHCGSAPCALPLSHPSVLPPQAVDKVDVEGLTPMWSCLDDRELPSPLRADAVDEGEAGAVPVARLLPARGGGGDEAGGTGLPSGATSGAGGAVVSRQAAGGGHHLIFPKAASVVADDL